MEIIKNVGFSTLCSGAVEKFRVDVTPRLVQSIREAIMGLKKHGFESIKIAWTSFDLLNYDDEVVTEEFRADGGISIIVFKGSIYFYVQSKFDSADQIESEAIDLNEIGIDEKDIVPYDESFSISIITTLLDKILDYVYVDLDLGEFVLLCSKCEQWEDKDSIESEINTFLPTIGYVYDVDKYQWIKK